MIYKNTIEFAGEMDQQDTLNKFRSRFLIPNDNGKEVVYFCGNSLGLQPVEAKKAINDQLANWGNLAIEGFFEGDDPWLGYHKKITPILSNILGAKTEELTIMNSLTVNLHLLMVSFYKPIGKRCKILMEGGVFPSDRYAIASQAKFHGYKPEDVIIEVFPRPDEFTLRTEDILAKMKENEDELALVLFGGINYFTGQCFDLSGITDAAHEVGAFAGFDLAHAAGNVPVKLHDWNVDFACWCSYKYMNSGPGGISGIYVHEKHFNNKLLNRFEGWWGYREDKRFMMTPEFEPEKGAAGWQLSTSPVLLLTLHKTALEIFKEAGGLAPLRAKSELLTGYLEFLICEINKAKGENLFRIITPSKKDERGCQLSIICKKNAKDIFSYLTNHGIIGDWREPNVIRLSPVPLYNSFSDVFISGQVLLRSVE